VRHVYDTVAGKRAKGKNREREKNENAAKSVLHARENSDGIANCELRKADFQRIRKAGN